MSAPTPVPQYLIPRPAIIYWRGSVALLLGRGEVIERLGSGTSLGRSRILRFLVRGDQPFSWSVVHSLS